MGWLAAGHAGGAAEEETVESHLEPLPPQHLGKLSGISEIGTVCPNHGEVLSTAQEKALYQRKHGPQMKQVKRAKQPTFGIRRFDHRKHATRLEDPRNEGRKLSMLMRVERLEPEGRNDEVRAARRQLAGKDIIFDELDLMCPVSVQALHGAAVHAGRDIDRGYRSDRPKSS